MKRKIRLPAAWVLPLLTIILILLAIVLPERISALRDRRLFAAAHVEAFDKEQGVASSAMTLEQRLRAVTELSFGGAADVYVRYGDTFSQEEIRQLDGMFQDSIQKLMDSAAFPCLQKLDVLNMECYGRERAFVWDSATMGNASFVQLHYYDEKLEAGVYLALDEESGLPISLTVFFPHMESLFAKEESRMLLERLRAFTQPLGFPVENSVSSGDDAYLILQGAEGDLCFHASQKYEVLNIELVPVGIMELDYDAQSSVSISVNGTVYDASVK